MISRVRSDCGTQGSHSAPGSRQHQARERVRNGSASSFFSSTDERLWMPFRVRPKSNKGNDIDRTLPTFTRYETSRQPESKHTNHRPQPRNPQEHDEMVSFCTSRRCAWSLRSQECLFSVVRVLEGMDAAGWVWMEFWGHEGSSMLAMDWVVDKLQGWITLGPWRCYSSVAMFMKEY